MPWLAGAVGAAVLLVTVWVPPGSLLPLDRGHGGEEVAELDPDVAADRGVARALADLHGHLNWAIWGGGEVDVPSWTTTLDRTVALTDEDGVIEALEQARELVVEDGATYAAHGAIETAELRYANASG